jgi:hypothetical protein
MKYFYICDGRACDKNCAENGFGYCKHTENEKHAYTKVRRQRKFMNQNGVMYEVNK